MMRRCAGGLLVAAAVLAHGIAGRTTLSKGSAPETAAPAPVHEPLQGELTCVGLAWSQDESAPEPAAADATAPAATVILDTRAFWRFRTVWETPEVVLPSGEVRHARVAWAKSAGAWFRENPTRGQLPEDQYTLVDAPEVVRLPADTPADWMAPGFDDSTWARLRGPMLDRTISENWKLILMRGLFEVTDPARAGDLTLSLAFKGGAVVYLNGEEVTRAAMPAGDLTLYTPADPYPEAVYFSPEGFAMFRYDRSPEGAPRIAGRIRTVSDVRIPASRLRKGVNVLGVAIHRAPTSAQFWASRLKDRFGLHDDCNWCKLALINVELTAPAGAAVVPNTGPVPGRGFKVWNQSIIQTSFLPDYPDAFAPLSPVQLTGVRNGTFAGQVVVGDEKPIRNLTAEVSDLTGPGVLRSAYSAEPRESRDPPGGSRAAPAGEPQRGVIPSSAVSVRYAVPDGAAGTGQAPFFDSLEEAPPDEVPVYAEHGGSVQVIWITVRVPADAQPGEYTGTVTIRAEGVAPVAVPIRLRVIDWTLPDVQDFISSMDFAQSPESVALAYNVPLWSEAHFKLLDKTFSLLAPLANKTLFITCIRRTHFGNEHAMLRWVRGDDGELKPDFTIVEKYLDVATRHLGQIPGVILYCWEPLQSQGHAGIRTWDKPILITVVDPETGELSARTGPAWGTPESQAFWKKMTDGFTALFQKRRLEHPPLFGLIGDSRPTRQAMDDITNGVTDPRWAVHSHFYCHTWQGHTVGMSIALWGIGVQPADPSAGYSFGWSNPFWLAYFPRELNLRSTLVEQRVMLEKWMGARRGGGPAITTGIGPRGLGRLGADFWPVLKDTRGRIRGTLAARYPEAAWGQLDLNNGIPYILGKGRNGPVATIRGEAFREGLQELEARIFLEKALLDPDAGTLLGDDLLARCRRAIDERIRMGLHAHGEGESWFISSDWRQRTERLFRLAAEVARKLGRPPNPNLEPQAAKGK